MTIAFDTLPWDDIVYVYIFPLVSLQTLFILRSVSHSLHSCVTGYFQELDLSNCHWLESEQFNLLASKCQDLERVSVSSCWNLNDDAIVALADSCKRIRVLSVAKIFCLTDRSISNVARQCPQLEHLDLRGCWRITDDAVRFLSEYTKHLRVVQVRECSLVTEASLSKLRAKGVSIDVPNYNHYRNMINLQV
ncbi:hypothetical protein LSAT2_011997 [Lamellibrachia satsuma]|nr:hypothetical protein LSAT2_011997 [Lamellibrachia satsuma]